MEKIEIKKGGKSDKHKELQKTAITWLYNQGCSIFAEEVPTNNGIADALGIRTRDDKHTIYYIEAKVSRSDLTCFKQKACYLRSTGNKDALCYYHAFNKFPDLMGVDRKMDVAKDCKDCEAIRSNSGDTGIDFYYFIIADGVKFEDTLYPEWGILNEKGEVIRRAKRRIREKESHSLIENVAHVLVYKCFGKLYLN